MGKKDIVLDLNRFDSLNADEGVWVNLLDPQDQPLIVSSNGKQASIKLVSCDSKTFLAIKHKIANKRIKKNKLTATAESLEDDRIELLSGCIQDWKNIVLDGQEFKFSTSNTMHLLKRFNFIADQIDFFVGDRSNFL